MNVLIPMAGAGARFSRKGYETPKPLIPLTSRHSLKTIPMVIEAVHDLPIDFNNTDTNLIFIVRDSHMKNDVDKAILKYYPRAQFVTIGSLTDGQASTCLLARDFFDTKKSLMIAACDNGMDLDREAFEKQTKDADSLIFTFRNNEVVLQNPEAYGWIRTHGNTVTGVSIKKPISNAPFEDHAVVGTFWFRHGHDFFLAADKMVDAGDRINGEFYVDQVFKYLIASGSKIDVTEVDRYLCWGTPEDYESYEATLAYWVKFTKKEGWTK